MRLKIIINRPGFWMVLGLVVAMGHGCAGVPTQPVVTPMASESENHRTARETESGNLLAKTFIWTVGCEVESGKTCEGHLVLFFPVDQAFCRYEYQIVEGPVGKTEQVISVENDSSIKVYIKAVGGPFWNPYESKIVLQVRGIGIARETDPGTQLSHFCDIPY